MPLNPQYYDAWQTETGWFGSKLLKKATHAVSSVAKVAGKGVSSVGKAVSKVPVLGSVAASPFQIAGGGLQGRNIAKQLGREMKTAGQVVSFMPGLGTAVGAGLKIGGAGIGGENIAKAAINAAKTAVPYANLAINAVTAARDIATGKNVFASVKNGAVSAALDAIPGGQYSAQLARSVLNVASAGVQGQNVINAGAKEVVASAIAMAPAVSRETLNAAILAASRGQNPLKGAAAAAVRTALSQIPDLGARKTAEAALAGIPAVRVLAQAPKALLARAASVVPSGGAAATFAALTGKTTDQITKGIQMAFSPFAHRPNLASLSRASTDLFTARPNLTTRQRLGLVHHIPMSGPAKKFVGARAGTLARDVAGLTADGKWLVTKGDTGSNIAKSLTGDSNRWKELTTVNPALMRSRAAQVKQYGFPIYVNDVINIPAGWVKTTVTAAAKATPVQVIPTTTAPTATTPVATAIQTVQTVLAPAGDIAAQAASRATLLAWSRTDGVSRAGVSDYGSNVEAAATSWTARDKLEAASFQSWANQIGLSTGATTGDWTQELANALRSWAEHKATQVLTPVVTTVAQQSTNPPANTSTPSATTTPTVVLPGTMAIPTTVVTPAVTVSPGSAQNGQITLPGITITPATASSGAAATTAEPSYWEQNKPQLISAAAGIAAVFGSKFIH